jgi:hypothetical protein
MSINGFWRTLQEENRRAILTDYGQINKVWYLFPQGGGPRGSFTTFSDLKGNLSSRDLIYLSGVLREQAVAPDGVFDVTILGAANRPRQATSSGTPTGGGAYWTAPTSPTATTPLLELKRAGWSIQNICFNPTTSSAAIRLTRSASVDLIDASHTSIDECYFVGGGTGQIGIEDNGGSGFVSVTNSRFLLLTGTGILSLNTAAAVPLQWEIVGNRFAQNTNDVKMSLSYGRITNNDFLTAGSGSTNKVISTTFISTQGGNNHILLNQFSNTEAEIAPGNGYTGAASDTWMNYVNNQAALAFGQPA